MTSTLANDGGKNAAFQKLKSTCVPLSQAILALNGPRGKVQTVTDRLEELKHALSTVTSRPHALDARLSEYAFFPISQALKLSQKLSIRCLELCLQCLAVLVEHGWREAIPPQLAGQIVILCSLLGERKPKGLSFSESTDELQASAFWCLYQLYSVAHKSKDLNAMLTSEANFPQLGQTISVLLDGINDSVSVEPQIAATRALEAFVSNVADRELRASFLPGIVSKLTRVLTPQTTARRNHKVLIACLRILSLLLRSTLSSEQLMQAQNGSSGKNASPTSLIDKQWQEKAAEQLKPALANIIRLSAHDREDVKDAVARLCLVLLKSCRETLQNCSHMAMKTLVVLTAADSNSGSATELEFLMRSVPSIAEMAEGLLYDWLHSLATTMQSSNEQAKLGKLEQVRALYQLLGQSGIDTSTVDRMLATSLRDSVVIATTVSRDKAQPELATPIQSLDLAVLKDVGGVVQYESPLVRYRGQEETLGGIEQLAKLATTSVSSSNFTIELARSLWHSRDEMQIANFWLLLTATENALQPSNTVDDLLNLENDTKLAHQQNLEELYFFSLSVLTEASEAAPNPRLLALALRALALRAQTAGPEFRYELVDALYPVLHTLATPDDQLQRDSITTLNIFSSTCGYTSVRDLIVENVDYLTNAVALKLNAFDVSPQAPQVLLMMVRLAGPSLLPYLEDTVESIFAALEDYHGYPLLVELLFRVLGVIAEEGVKAPLLAISNGEVADRDSVAIERWEPTTVNGLASLLRERAREEAEAADLKSETAEPHPRKPWKSIEEVKDISEQDEQDSSNHDQRMDDVEPPPPAPKTYSLLLKITELTQHFLPSASPSLRTSLLGLIRTTVPAIARHENSFLPLINTLWPEVVSRLDDSEPHIVATALDIVSILCEYACDFMHTRIIELWPRLLEIYQTTAKDVVKSSAITQSKFSGEDRQRSQALLLDPKNLKQAVALMQDSPATYGDTSARLTWLALTNCFTTVVQYVNLPPDKFDEALEMMMPLLGESKTRHALETENADAVWLAAVRSEIVARPEVPNVPDGVSWQFAEVPG